MIHSFLSKKSVSHSNFSKKGQLGDNSGTTFNFHQNLQSLETVGMLRFDSGEPYRIRTCDLTIKSIEKIPVFCGGCPVYLTIDKIW